MASSVKKQRKMLKPLKKISIKQRDFSKVKGPRIKFGNGTYVIKPPSWFDATLLYGNKHKDKSLTTLKSSS